MITTEQLKEYKEKYFNDYLEEFEINPSSDKANRLTAICLLLKELTQISEDNDMLV